MKIVYKHRIQKWVKTLPKNFKYKVYYEPSLTNLKIYSNSNINRFDYITIHDVKGKVNDSTKSYLYKKLIDIDPLTEGIIKQTNRDNSIDKILN